MNEEIRINSTRYEPYAMACDARNEGPDAFKARLKSSAHVVVSDEEYALQAASIKAENERTAARNKRIRDNARRANRRIPQNIEAGNKQRHFDPDSKLLLGRRTCAVPTEANLIRAAKAQADKQRKQRGGKS
jgi:hypothetical protein